MSGAISAVSVAGATAAAAGAGTAGIAGAALAANIGAIATGASLLGTGVSAIGSIEQGKAASASASYNAAVAANNAKTATQNAQFAGAEGEQNAAASAAKTRAQVGATLANQGASGVDINSGSDVDVRESEAKLGTLNELNIRSQAARTAYGYQTQSVSDLGQQALDKSQASSATTAGYLNAGANVLGGVGNAFKTYPTSNNSVTNALIGSVSAGQSSMPV